MIFFQRGVLDLSKELSGLDHFKETFEDDEDLLRDTNFIG
jgi:hypothetical protein